MEVFPFRLLALLHCAGARPEGKQAGAFTPSRLKDHVGVQVDAPSNGLGSATEMLGGLQSTFFPFSRLMQYLLKRNWAKRMK
mmetsp:Transcript_95376/g.213621  ORF Transcript_95376/g.213621 Transcript_95376/m.213621 type:complete len:82 (+) Transcript_95376:7-252(+)